MKPKKKPNPKSVDVGRSEDDMSAPKGKGRVNTKIVPNKRPSKSPSGGGVRG